MEVDDGARGKGRHKGKDTVNRGYGWVEKAGEVAPVVIHVNSEKSSQREN